MLTRNEYKKEFRMTEQEHALLDSVLPSGETSIVRDLKLNFKRLFMEGALSQEEALLTLLAVSTSVQNEKLMSYSKSQLEQLGVPRAHVQEAVECASIMAMLNMYYRFRHLVGKEEDYRTAGLRMTALAKPVLGKERFEMLAFAVSVINGCESCVRSHEQVLRDAGVSADKVHDLARFAAVVRGIDSLLSSTDYR